MTEEELKNKLISEAQASWNKLNITKRVSGSEFSYYDGYIDCGFIKEEQIQIDAEQIRALQKQNGELTDELKTLRESMKDYGAGCYENGLRNGRRKLEAQIDKMKYALNKIVKTVQNDNISGYGDRLVKIYDISCEILQELEK